MSIKALFLLVVNVLVVAVVLALSMAFYTQFRQALDERVLLQLTSIKRLKRIQIEDFLNREWVSFSASTQNNVLSGDSVAVAQFLGMNKPTGIYDLTPINPDGQLLIGFIDRERHCVKLIGHEQIQHILLERTGMGNSGETYLVGADFRMRSQSRFFPDTKPYAIKAKTFGVVSAFKGGNGHGVFDDYRGIEVYSAYHHIKIKGLNLAILSEIDTDEAMQPIQQMREKLAFIALVVVLVAVFISLYLAKIMAKPIEGMRQSLQQMAIGIYKPLPKAKHSTHEIQDMFDALAELQTSLVGAVDFSLKIGEMKLESPYHPTGDHDYLGHSLLKMRNNLAKYRQKELEQTLGIKKMLIDRQETERKQLAMELHDGIGPLLTSLKLYIQNNIDDPSIKATAKELLDSTIAEVRMMSYALAPASLIDLGIGRTLNDFVTKIRQNSTIDIAFEDLTMQEESSIPTNLGINVFRICQELINNAMKHSLASKVMITLSEFSSHLSLFYYDNGIGYDTSQVYSGAGIANIKERVALFNGLLEVNSAQGRTTVEIEIPMTNG